MSLREQTFTAIRWTSIATLAKVILQLTQLVIVARILPPSDFGLLAIAIAIMSFAQVFSDLGLSNALIHKRDISSDQLSTLYWLNAAAAMFLMIILLLISPVIAEFYGDEKLYGLLVLISLQFPAAALGQQLRSMGEKKLRFDRLAKIEIVAGLAGFGVTLTWVLLSPQIMALVAGLVTSALTASLLYWIFLSDGWKPRLHCQPGEVTEFLSFGGYSVGTNLVNAFSSQADIFLGGRFLNSAALGLYSLPRDLSLRVSDLINPIVTRVGLPVMAQVQADLPRLKSAYLQTLRMTASINFPVYCALALVAPELVHLLLGEQWQGSIELLRVLAVWALFRSIANPVGSLLFATGRASLSFKWNLALLVIIPPVIWIGSRDGAMGLALAQMTLIICLIIPTWYFLVRPCCGASLKEYLLNLSIPLFASIIATVSAYGVLLLIEPPLQRLLAGLVSGGAVYLAASLLLNRSWLLAMRTLLVGGTRTDQPDR